MKYIGKWEVSAALSFVDGKIKWVTREEANSIEDFDLSLFSPIMEFARNGSHPVPDPGGYAAGRDRRGCFKRRSGCRRLSGHGEA